MVAQHVTPADVDDRSQVGALTCAVQAETDGSVETAFVDQGDTGERPAKAADANGIELEVVKAPEAKRGFVLLPRRWVVERTLAGATRGRRLVEDYGRSASTLAGMYMVAFVCSMLAALARIANTS